MASGTAAVARAYIISECPPLISECPKLLGLPFLNAIKDVAIKDCDNHEVIAARACSLSRHCVDA